MWMHLRTLERSRDATDGLTSGVILLKERIKRVIFHLN